jgi:hypothetical protein
VLEIDGKQVLLPDQEANDAILAEFRYWGGGQKDRAFPKLGFRYQAPASRFRTRDSRGQPLGGVRARTSGEAPGTALFKGLCL